MNEKNRPILWLFDKKKKMIPLSICLREVIANYCQISSYLRPLSIDEEETSAIKELWVKKQISLSFTTWPREGSGHAHEHAAHMPPEPTGRDIASRPSISLWLQASDDEGVAVTLHTAIQVH